MIWQRATAILLTVGLLTAQAAAQPKPKQWIIPLKYIPAPATAETLAEFVQRKKLSARVTADAPTNQIIVLSDEETFSAIQAKAEELDTDVSSVEIDLLLLKVSAEVAERVGGKAGGKELTVREARILMAAACDAKERGEAELLSRQSFDLGDREVGEFELKGQPTKLTGRLTPRLGFPTEGAELKIEFSTTGEKARTVEATLDRVAYNGIAVFRGPRSTADGASEVLAIVVVKHGK